MPTKKYVRRSKKRTNKYSKRQKVPNNKQLSTRLKKLEHATELKYHDTVYTTDVYANTSTYILMSNPAQGDNVEERLGLEIEAKYLNIKLQLAVVPSIYNVKYRIIVFWDKQANGAAPTLAATTDPSKAILDDNIIGSLNYSPHNYRTKDRYMILMDKLYSINPQDDPKIVVFDYPRTMEGMVNYTAIEACKDGRIFSAKYESKMKYFNIPHVCVFCNFPPDYEKMSMDRWEVICLDEEA